MRIRRRTWRWCPFWFQVTLQWDSHAWAVGIWLNYHEFQVALGYLFLDIDYRRN